MSFFPPVPSDTSNKATFTQIFQREVRIYRRFPSFIIGMAMASISAFILMFLTHGILERIPILIGIFGVALVYDTVTRHFCGLLYKLEKNEPLESKKPKTSET